MEESETIVISLGGSIVSPKAGEVNINFLKRFRQMILKFLKKNYRFVIIVGGGKVCRLYQTAASKIAALSNDDKDWLGIHATRFNAHLLRTIFRKEAYPVLLDDPHKPVKNHWKLLVAAGWRPGNSTDYIAVLLARRFRIKEIINAGNIPFVFEKDPSLFKNAKKFERISWKNYRKLIGSKWSPGLSTPFDPVAAKLAEELKIRVFIIDGADINNFEKAVNPPSGGFRGTIISSQP